MPAGPGRFEGEGAATVILWMTSMESGQDEELTLGGDWYAIFRGPYKESDFGETVFEEVRAEGYTWNEVAEGYHELRSMAGAILTQASTGFIGSDIYSPLDSQDSDPERSLNEAWDRLLVETAEGEDDTP